MASMPGARWQPGDQSRRCLGQGRADPVPIPGAAPAAVVRRSRLPSRPAFHLAQSCPTSVAGRIRDNPQGTGQSGDRDDLVAVARSEEHTSELQSLMRISYAVFCLKKKNNTKQTIHTTK